MAAIQAQDQKQAALQGDYVAKIEALIKENAKLIGIIEQ